MAAGLLRTLIKRATRGPKPTKIKNPPLQLTSTADSLIATKRLPSKPAWYPVVSAHPPHIITPVDVDPLAVGQFAALGRMRARVELQRKESRIDFTSPYADEAPLLDPVPKGVREPCLQVTTRTVPEIYYPEDEIRKAFYKLHPFELDRPISLVETEETLVEAGEPWVDIRQGKEDAWVTGE
ncbi:mitochondrial ribosomal protein S25, partial [Blyttiomyces helicus]